ncbi:MAG: DNA-3-methyladenine glycosylase 2 family protein [Sphaerochaeta sp.]
MSRYFVYGEKELGHLRRNDPILGSAIDRIGMITRAVEPDFFTSITRSIIGQQISTKAQNSIFERLNEMVGTLVPTTIVDRSIEELQSVGMTFRKAEYIQGIAYKMVSGELDPASFSALSDSEVIEELVKLKGIGVWTAEMTLIFCLQRPDIVSYGDLAIIRGMKMLYSLETITKKEFDAIRSRFSPYGSIASLYIWAVAGGRLPPLD